jgi:hypothetical protein
MNSSSLEELQKLQQRSAVQAEADPAGYRARLRRQLFGLQVWSFLPILLFALLLGVSVWAFYAVGAAWGSALLLLACLILFGALWGLQLAQPMPACYAVGAESAPELFRQLAKMRLKLQAPSIAGVGLVSDFSLFICERRRWDFWGKTELHLYIGLPFLASASPERMLALIAQEYAHWRQVEKRTDSQIYRLRRRWLMAVPSAAELGSLAPQTWALPYITRLRQRFVINSLALARAQELAADAAVAKIYGRDRMAEALVENAIVAHHIRHEHWRQYWQLACKLAKPPMGPYAWLAAWQIKPPKARAVEERFAELLRQEPAAAQEQPCTRQRVQALGLGLDIPAPSARHAGVLLGKALPAAIKQFDQQWWDGNAPRWQVLHLQYQQEQDTITELEQKIDHLAVQDLERLAQLYKRHLRENDAEMVYRRIRDLDAYNAYALWQQIEFLMERNDDNALLSLAEMVERHPEHQHRAILLALGLIEKLPQTPEVQDLRASWKERLAQYDAQDQAWQIELQHTALLAHTQAAQLSVWQLEDLRVAAQRIPSILRIWVLEKTRPVSNWRKAFVLVLEQRPGDAVPAADIAAEFAWLGRVFAINAQDLPAQSPSLHLDDLGQAVYAGSSSQRFKPLLGATRRNTGPVPLGLH